MRLRWWPITWLCLCVCVCVCMCVCKREKAISFRLGGLLLKLSLHTDIEWQTSRTLRSASYLHRWERTERNPPVDMSSMVTFQKLLSLQRRVISENTVGKKKQQMSEFPFQCCLFSKIKVFQTTTRITAYSLYSTGGWFLSGWCFNWFPWHTLLA